MCKGHSPSRHTNLLSARNGLKDSDSSGGGLEYTHSRPTSHRRRWKGNPLPERTTGPSCHQNKQNKLRGLSPLTNCTDRATRLSAKLVPTFVDREGCRVVRVTTAWLQRNLGFLDRSRYYFFQVAPQLYSRGWVDPVPDPLLSERVHSTENGLHK
jgi:hypothetical protein